MVKSEVLAERYAAIQEAQNALTRLMWHVCFMCAREEALFCEVVNGQHYHTTGRCLASPIRELKSHADDIRDQFANEFNADEKPRAVWSFRCIPELVKRDG